MNRKLHSHSGRRARAAVLLTTGFLLTFPLGGTAASGAASAPSSPGDRHCRLDPAHLPKTADAAEGWFASCRARAENQGRAGHPGSADAAEHWLR